MKTSSRAGCLLAALLLCTQAYGEPPAPPRLKRADSFIGIHFDFHAGPDGTAVGQHTTPAMIENIINRVHPDYLQVDCKGHPGFSSYPTQVGHPAPGFGGDPLRTWRSSSISSTRLAHIAPKPFSK